MTPAPRAEGQRKTTVAEIVPWEEVKIQLDPQEQAQYEACFAGAKDRFYLQDVKIFGRRYMVAPSGKVWLIIEKESDLA